MQIVEQLKSQKFKIIYLRLQKEHVITGEHIKLNYDLVKEFSDETI
jgi:hypothetical protein